MVWVKFLHLLGMIVYVGGFLALTRMVGHAVRFETEASRADAYRIFRRMHKFVNWGGLALMVICGLILLIVDPWDKNYMRHPSGYFHMKLAFIVGLLICDVFFSRILFLRLRAEGEQPKRAVFSALHGIAALMVIGVLISIFVVRDSHHLG